MYKYKHLSSNLGNIATSDVHCKLDYCNSLRIMYQIFKQTDTSKIVSLVLSSDPLHDIFALYFCSQVSTLG